MSTDPITSQAAAALGRMNAGKRKNLSPEARAALAARCAARNRERGERIRAARAARAFDVASCECGTKAMELCPVHGAGAEQSGGAQ